MKKENRWVLIALLWLCISVGSLFVGVISYTPPSVALCLFLVAREQRRIKKAAAAAKENVYIHAAGDL